MSSFSGWNEPSIQYAIENHYPLLFDKYTRVDLEQFCDIMYQEYKKMHIAYLDLCKEYGEKPIVKNIDFSK